MYDTEIFGKMFQLYVDTAYNWYNVSFNSWGGKDLFQLYVDTAYNWYFSG